MNTPTTPPSSESTAADQMIRGAMWMVGMRWAMRALGFVNIIIIARILSPEDFGLIAMAMALIGLVVTLTDGSFDHALVRNPNANQDDFDSAWTLQATAGVIATGGIWLFAPLAVQFFEHPMLGAIFFWGGMRPAIQGLESMATVNFRKQQKFHLEFRYWVLRQVLSVSITITLALIFRNYMALAISMPLSGLAVVILSYVLAPYRPRLHFDRAKEVLHFSKWMLTLDLSRLIARRADEITVAKVADLGTLGEYNIAADLATMPTRELTFPLERAFTPVLADLKDDKELFRETFEQTVGVLFVVCLSVGSGLFAISHSLVATFLGEQWLGAIPFFQVFALSGIFVALTLGLHSFFIVSTHVKAYALMTALYVPLLVALVIAAGVYGDAMWIALVRTVSDGILCVAIFSYACRQDWSTPQNLARQTWRPLASSAVMVTVISLFNPPATGPMPLFLIAQCLTGAACFTATLTLLWYLSGKPIGPESAGMAYLNKLRRENAATAQE